MIIADSNISMSSAHSRLEREGRSSELKAWTGPRPAAGPDVSRSRPAINRNEVVDISDEARARLESMKKKFVHGKKDREIDMPEGIDHETFIKKLLLEALTGKKIEVRSVSKPSGDAPAAECASQPRQADTPVDDWGMDYKQTEFQSSVEEVSFSASGTIKTADGQEVGFTLDLAMQRASLSVNTTEIKAGNAIDPLVVNFGGTAAELSSFKFDFDMDSDGSAENISFAGPGSGFLAIDRNNDGKVNNGSELFGPKTGDGFKELSALDSDGNSWVDEKDNAYNSLYVWMKDAAGKDVMKTLKQADIGAICLSYAATAFDIRDQRNSLNGLVRNTGIFLKEDMTPGTIQQIDLVA